MSFHSTLIHNPTEIDGAVSDANLDTTVDTIYAETTPVERLFETGDFDPQIDRSDHGLLKIDLTVNIIYI